MSRNPLFTAIAILFIAAVLCGSTLVVVRIAEGLRSTSTSMIILLVWSIAGSTLFITFTDAVLQEADSKRRRQR